MTTAARVAAGALALGVASAAPAADGPAPGWARAFATDPRAGDVHALVRYRGGDGAWHRLELWRRGDASVHRRTDDRLDVHVTRDEHAAGGFRYQVRDARRGTWIEVDRANLFRIGVFSDWGSLAHLLRLPASPVALSPVAPAAAAAAASAASTDCATWRITPQPAGAGPANEVCWSSRWGLPLRVVGVRADGSRETMLEVLRVEVGAPDDPGFGPPVPAAGDAYVDANADIDPAAD